MRAFAACVVLATGVVQADLKSRAEAEARKIEASISQGDASELERFLDLIPLIEELGDRVGAPGPRRGTVYLALRRMGFPGRQIVDLVEAGERDFHFVRYRTSPPRLLFRAIGDSAFDYYEIHVEEVEGSVRGVDLRFHSTGLGIVSLSLELFENAKQPVVPKHFEVLRAAAEQLEAGDASGSYAALGELSAEVRSQRTCALLLVKVASGVSDDAFQKAIADYKAAGHDPSPLGVWEFGHALKRQDRAGVHAALATVEKTVGGDPAIELYRALAETLPGGSPRKLEEHAQLAIAGDPRLLERGRFMLLEASVRAEQHERTLELLLLLSREHGVEWNDLSKEDAFKKFVGTPAYETWKERIRGSGRPRVSEGPSPW